MITNPNMQAEQRDLVNNNIWSLVGTAAPTNGTSGTGAGMAGPCSTYADIVGKKVYINTGTMASPTWQYMNVT